MKNFAERNDMLIIMLSIAPVSLYIPVTLFFIWVPCLLAQIASLFLVVKYKLWEV
jgi:hypothetical protein